MINLTRDRPDEIIPESDPNVNGIDVCTAWEQHIYFNYPRPEAGNTEPDPYPRHSLKFWTRTRSGLGLGFSDSSGPVNTSTAQYTVYTVTLKLYNMKHYTFQSVLGHIVFSRI